MRGALLRELAVANKAARVLESSASEISESLADDRGKMVFPLMTRLNPADAVLRMEKDNGEVLEFAVTALALARKDKDAQASWEVSKLLGDGGFQRHGIKLMSKRGKTLRPLEEQEMEKARAWLDGEWERMASSPGQGAAAYSELGRLLQVISGNFGAGGLQKKIDMGSMEAVPVGDVVSRQEEEDLAKQLFAAGAPPAKSRGRKL